MKPFVFNKDSWHYWLATEVGAFSKYRTDSNICEYTRAVLKGVLLLTFFAAVFSAIVYWITITVVWWVVILQHGFFEAEGPIVLSAIVGIFCTAWFIGGGIPWAYRKVKRAVYEARYPDGYREKIVTDNFLTHAYRSWKEKTCVRVTLVGTPED